MQIDGRDSTHRRGSRLPLTRPNGSSPRLPVAAISSPRRLCALLRPPRIEACSVATRSNVRGGSADWRSFMKTVRLAFIFMLAGGLGSAAAVTIHPWPATDHMQPCAGGGLQACIDV